MPMLPLVSFALYPIDALCVFPSFEYDMIPPQFIPLCSVAASPSIKFNTGLFAIFALNKSINLCSLSYKTTFTELLSSSIPYIDVVLKSISFFSSAFLRIRFKTFRSSLYEYLQFLITTLSTFVPNKSDASPS